MFLFIYYYIMAEKKLSIDERLAILDEFADFYEKQPASFCFHKWVALTAIRDFVADAKEELDDDELVNSTCMAIAGIDTDALWEQHNMGELWQSFFEWWLWLWLKVLKWDTDAIKEHRKMMEEIEKLPIPTKFSKNIGAVKEIIEEIRDMIDKE